MAESKQEPSTESFVRKQGYVKIRSHGIFMKRKKQWIILKDSQVSVEKKLLLIFKSEKDSKNAARSSQTISLKDANDLDLINISGSFCGINLRLKDNLVQKLAFASELEAKEWYEHLNVVCFGSVLGKGFKTDAENVDGDSYIKPDSSKDSATLNEVQDVHHFSVFLQPSAKLQISGDCGLQITPINIELFDSKCSNVKLVSWPINSMRRFGFDIARFTFEAGRRCDTGEGMFVFTTTDGEQIHKLVQTYAETLALQTRSISGTDSNDNDEFELRPLPPVPPD